MKAKNYLDELHVRLRQAREKTGASQEKFAAKACISRSRVSRFESGKLSPTLHEVNIIAELTGVNFEHLVLGPAPLQQALDQIDEIGKFHSIQTQRIEKYINHSMSQMRGNYIAHYGFPDQNYPVKK